VYQIKDQKAVEMFYEREFRYRFRNITRQKAILVNVMFGKGCQALDKYAELNVLWGRAGDGSGNLVKMHTGISHTINSYHRPKWKADTASKINKFCENMNEYFIFFSFHVSGVKV
jgi:hypothetical protein